MKKNKRFYLIAPAVVLGLLFVGVASQWHGDLPVEQLKSHYAKKPSQFVQVKGMQVHYRDEGQGPPLILLHGVGDSLHVWQDWVGHLQNQFRIVRLDIPGQGLTGPHPGRDYSINMQVDFIKAFMDTLQIETTHLAGNSMGGNISWAFASAHPNRVKRLVLIDPAGYYRPDAKTPMVFKLARNNVAASILRYWTPRAFIKRNLLQVYYNDHKVNDELVQRYFQMSLRAGNRQAFIDRANRSKPVGSEIVRKQLGQITAPTLIMWGRQDVWIPVENAHFFDQAIKTSRVQIYEGCGHLPHAELPLQTARDAADFLLKPVGNPVRP